MTNRSPAKEPGAPALLVLNLMLMLGWCGAFGTFSPWALATGFAAGFAALWLTRHLWGTLEGSYFRRTIAGFSFSLFYAKALVVSAWQVARQVLSPTITARPGVIAVPLTATRDVEIATLANLVTLTPGTMSIDVSDDRSTLYVHVMLLDDPDAVIADIRDNFEARLLEVLR
ncbi:Na+/H+ antiporter subunit E [Elioraea sp.]|uniref:Na+/H+ antiporter subunit E n=1 Tax=Elioraea sp. TaxID=2185103 RepID=UPI0025B8A761|nr:Na+/H+ antiporter subunit E [Elioraea sp.]